MKMISKFNLFIAICMLSSMFAIDDPTNVCATGAEFDPYGGTAYQPAITATWEDTNPAEGCGDDEVEDCDGTGECWPASWIGDGFPDCEDQQYGADLTCYDCDGGDCPESDPGCGGDGTTGGTTGGTTDGGTTGGSADCEDCELDWSAYGSECCDTAWDEFGIDCATLESGYGWDCSGCNCPGDGPAECGDGSCTGDETYETCPEDCPAPGECADDEVLDCDDSGECWTAGWIGDGFADCNDQQYGADLCCYDLDGGDCTEEQCDGDDSTDTGGGTTGGTTGGSSDCEDCELDWSAYGSECCDTAFVEYGIDCATLETTYGWDCSGCNCPGDAAGSGNGGDGDLSDLSEVDANQASSYETKNDARSIVPNKALMMNAAHVRDLQDTPQDRSINAAVHYSCDTCLDGGPWEYTWTTSTTTGATGFTVYGFDAGAVVNVDVTLSSNTSGEVSNTVGPVSAVAGDPSTQECANGNGGCDTAGTGDVNADGATNVLDIVAIVNVILGGAFADDCAASSADLNGDGEANVLDIVAIVNIILGNGRAADATSVELNRESNSLRMDANGYIGGLQMTLSHGEDFVLDLTDDAMVADHVTEGTSTTLVIVKPESNELFTANSDFVITDMIVANSQGAMDVVYAPQTISLSKAYPNPFNPSTTISMSLHQDGFASVKIYNLMGQQVAVLAEANMTANTYSFTWDAQDAPSGVYMVKAESAGQTATEKVMLVK
jgi:hypothetical protein